MPLAFVLSFIIHAAIAVRPYPRGRLAEIALLHLFFWLCGIGYFLGFYALSFEPLSTRVATDFTWQPGNFFQIQSGLGLLCVAVLGFLAVAIRGSFWVATLVMALVMGWTELGAVLINGATPDQVHMIWVHEGVVPALMAILLVIYRIQVGSERFWVSGRASG